MDRFARLVQGVVQFLSEAVEREWRTPEERRFHSSLSGPWYDEVGAWLEQFAGHAIWQHAVERREEVRAYARGVRDELAMVLAQVEPPCAMAVLCGLPTAQGLGYEPERLAGNLGVAVPQVQAWEREGYLQMRAALTERTPLLAFLHALAVEQESGDGEVESLKVVEAVEAQLDEETLLSEARTNPTFDLRLYVAPHQELAIRQWLHRQGMEAMGEAASVASLFPEVEPVVVRLVQARLELEMSSGEEVGEDA